MQAGEGVTTQPAAAAALQLRCPTVPRPAKRPTLQGRRTIKTVHPPRTWLAMPEPKMVWLVSWVNSRKAGIFSACRNASSFSSSSLSLSAQGGQEGQKAG